MTDLEKYIFELSKLDIYKAVFSLKAEKDGKYIKAVLKKLPENTYQLESFTEKQAFHENFGEAELCGKIFEIFPSVFKQSEIFTGEYVYSAKISKKGKLLHSRRKNTESVQTAESHNRKKNHIIDVENLPPVFREIGISDESGKIINSKYDKFKQICRFTELINDEVSKDTREEYNIVDFGCGKSYLTFIIYFYFTELLHKKVNITGLDLKEDVIAKCNALAGKYGYENLHFLCMDIKDYVPGGSVDMVIALHACDTATDYALFNAVKWKSDYIFSVPCCQKEVNGMIKAESLTLLTDYGLIKERFSSLVTDAMRAKLLEEAGYTVDVAEFIGFEFSPKNVLIRAKRRKSADRYKISRIKGEMESVKKEFGAEITLEKLLKDENLI